MKFFLIVVVLGGLYCTDLTNPYLDADNAMAKISDKNFSDSDSLKIFSTKSLSVVVYLKEHVEKFKLHIDKNRLWSSEDTVITKNKFNKEPFLFDFSFYDTGWQQISLTTYRNNGDSVVEKYTVYAYSPLYQNTIKARVGDTILLKTDPVGDKVLYVWNFRNGTPVKDQSPVVRTVFSNSMTSSVGELYVEDFTNHKSPVILFNINPSSSDELSIRCVNDSIKNDTIYTTAKELPLKLQIMGAEQVKKLTVNGNAIGNLSKVDNYHACTVNLKGLDSITNPLNVIVEVTDNKNRTVKDTFYVVFVNHWPGISVTFPADDSIETMASSVMVTGNVTSIGTFRSLFLVIRNNGKIQNNKIVLPENSGFSFSIPLSEYKNHMVLELFTDSMMTSRIATNDFYVFYVPEGKDTLAPQIRSVRGNGAVLNRISYSGSDTLNLEIIATDNSGFVSVFVNDQSAVKNDSSLIFSATVNLKHEIKGNQILVKAIDSNGLSDIDTFLVYYNRLPQWSKLPPSYMVADVGSITVFNIVAQDPDGDSLTVSMTIKTNPEKLFNISSGTIGWIPEAKDTGEYTVNLLAWDGYQEIDTSFIIRVKSPSSLTPVKISNRATDISDTIFVGDSLNIKIEAVSSTGTRPFQYNAYFTDKKTAPLLNGTDSVLSWKPTVADTGYRVLRLVITDNAGFKDSVSIPIVIVRRALAEFRWDENNSVNFYEGDTTNNYPKVKLGKSLDKAVSIAYKIEFVNPADSADIEAPYSGVVNFPAGDTIASVPVKIVDDSLPENVKTFRIRLFESDTIKLRGTDIFTGQIIDDDIVWYYFEEPEGTGKESVTNVSVKVKISRPLTVPVELFYSSGSESSATISKDFIFVDPVQKLTFNPGVTENYIQLKIIDDKIPEKDEVIILNLNSENNFTKPKDSPVYEYTIIDNDTVSHFSFISNALTGSESDTLDTIVIKLDRPVDSVTVLKLLIDNDPAVTTATEGIDFRFIDDIDSIVFPKGVTTRNIRIKIFDDTIPEGDEKISLVLQSNSELLSPGIYAQAVYTIKTNEVNLYFDADSSIVDEWTRQPIPLVIKMDGGPLKERLTVYYSEDPQNTAISGKDFFLFPDNSHRVVFEPGETSKQFSYIVNDDWECEGTEYATIRISGVSNNKIAYPGEKAKIVIKIGDNDCPR